MSNVAFTTAPNVKSKTETSVTIGFAVDYTAGEVCCIVLNEKSQTEYESNNLYKPSSEQIYLGVDVNNAQALSSKCIDAETDSGAATEITLDGLEAGNKYSAFCTATNGYLVWPAYVDYSVNKDAQTPENFTTNGEAESDDSDDDSALLVSSNIVAICTMIAALIFN